MFIGRATDVISEARFSTMTEEDHDELSEMNFSTIAVALTPL